MKTHRLVVIIVVVTVNVLFPASASISNEELVFSEEYTASLSFESSLVVLDHLFKLRAISDGAEAQWISIDIGSFIVTQPKAFLIALSKNPDAVVGLGSIVGNLGDGFVDKVVEQISALEVRYNAVLSVGNEAPIDAKIIVLFVLSKKISFLRDILVHDYCLGQDSELITQYLNFR